MRNEFYCTSGMHDNNVTTVAPHGFVNEETGETFVTFSLSEEDACHREDLGWIDFELEEAKLFSERLIEAIAESEKAGREYEDYSK